MITSAYNKLKWVVISLRRAQIRREVQKRVDKFGTVDVEILRCAEPLIGRPAILRALSELGYMPYAESEDAS